MGWSEVAARSHARRLEQEGWLERCPMTRGDGSLFLATRKGVRVLGLPFTAACVPAPTWWAHDSACAWTAAWLTVRGRRFLGAREILDDPSWSGRLEWLERSGYKRSSHRPELIGFAPTGGRVAIEVELASKSKARLDTILMLHRSWIASGQTGAVAYICRDDDGRRRIAQAGGNVGLHESSGRIRLETLDTIKAQTVTAFEQSCPLPTRSAVA